MSRQHESGGARFIPAINKSERGASCDKVWGESTENWNPDKVLLLLLEELLKENKNGKGQKSSSSNKWARCEAKAQSVRVEQLLLTRRICCHVSQADGCSPRCRASFLWWAAGSCDAPASVCRCSSASWPGATSTNTTHTHVHAHASSATRHNTPSA